MSYKKKPDLLTVLAIVVTLGVIGSGVAQGMFSQSPTDAQVAKIQAPSDKSSQLH